MGYELMEQKTDESHYGFLVRETIMNNIITWKDFPHVDEVKEYLNNNPFPKDRLYSEEEFLEEVEGSDMFILLQVEKRQTADFILNMICELV